MKKFDGKKSIFHVFGTSSIPSIIVLTYLQYKLNEKSLDIQITYDSASPSHYTINGKYLLSLNKTSLTPLVFSSSNLKSLRDSSGLTNS